MGLGEVEGPCVVVLGLGWGRCSPASFPQAVVRGLLSPAEDHSLLLSQFREYLEFDDIRYHTMQAASDAVAQVTSQQPEVSGWV